MAAPIDGQTCHPNHPAGKTVLQHRTPVISERLSKSAGFCDRQSLQLRWDDFFSLVSRPHGVSYFPAKSLVPTGTAFTACPAYRFPVIPGRLHLSRWCHPSSSRYLLELVFAGILFFLIFLFRGNLSCYIQNRKFNLSLMNLFILVWKNYYPLLFVVTFLNLNKWTVCFVLNVMTVQILSRQNFFSLMMNFNGEDI